MMDIAGVRGTCGQRAEALGDEARGDGYSYCRNGGDGCCRVGDECQVEGIGLIGLANPLTSYTLSGASKPQPALKCKYKYNH